MYFPVYEFQVGVNDSIFSGNKQQKVYYLKMCRYSSVKTTNYQCNKITVHLLESQEF